MIDLDGGLLHLDCAASARTDSVSRRLTGLFARIWRERTGAGGYRYRDLAADPVPLLGAAYVSLGQRVERHGAVPPERVAPMAESERERREWALTLPLVTDLRTAGTVLLGVPMYNLTVPAAFKAWIDRVSFPGMYTDPGTGESLLRDTKIVVVMAQGGAYGLGTPREGYDFQTPYLRAYFGRLGVAGENLHFVRAEMTRADDVPELASFRGYRDRSLAEAHAAVEHLAAGLCPAAR
ncbi:NAD(P)H dehydrogenase [Amycolatopsis rhizosphaerae]|uniref:FMN dependent NADH:quinone oxidoreductase n=1 Tax=Amycolatopsis rhizosphaerae TaxID=2053003 RepID=A0A558C8M3_9PSEU|nr:NAD(P)H-dependent oxidoreductase [Amycolatopsis rhizosphaerae]TVT44972.1 NAD(P)H dehydrogenase [Amycolatopsis rhizosphaerae]